uniref:Uncharacterized protein n=1 Tax=Myotis myotis TaxID=51298 RepID=A0A7J7VI61_MYOMY|nr:hypothetical protein mMyoMyo1_008269 [Myotis myotis]
MAISTSLGPSRPHQGCPYLNGTVSTSPGRLNLTGAISASPGLSQPHQHRFDLTGAILTSPGPFRPHRSHFSLTGAVATSPAPFQPQRCCPGLTGAISTSPGASRPHRAVLASPDNTKFGILSFLGGSLLDKISRRSWWLNIWYACLDFVFY